MISNFSFALPSQVLVCTGIKFCRKSPDKGSIKRQDPSGALTETPENARVAVSSRWLASAAASAFNVPPARSTAAPLAAASPPVEATLAVLFCRGKRRVIGGWVGMATAMAEMERRESVVVNNMMTERLSGTLRETVKSIIDNKERSSVRQRVTKNEADDLKKESEVDCCE